MNLLPCPFCGGEAVLNHGHIITATGQCLANVKCSECGVATKVVWSTDSPEEAVKEAIEAWNHRAETTTEMLMRVLAYDATCGACDKRKERIAKVETYTDDQQETWSVCECGTDVWKSYNYCPECGAKLDWSE